MRRHHVKGGVRKVTLAAVAKAAGVSAATVSRLIRGTARVEDGTREQILSAARRLNFDIEAKKTSRIIAFLLSNRGVLHPFHSAMLMGAEEYCSENNYGLLFLPFEYSLTLPAERLMLPDILLRKTVVAGVIAAGVNSQALLESLSSSEIPWVVLGNNVVGDWSHQRSRSVFFDDVRGADELTRYLISLGHERIGFVGNQDLPWYLRRYEGYKKAMSDAGFAVHASEVNSRDGEEMGYLGTRLLLERRPRVTAVFAGDDAAARGAYKAARDSGLEVPHDLTVAGFNDTLDAVALDPALTSVHVYTTELGRQASELLLRQIAEPRSEVPSIVLPTRLVRRESCTPPQR